MSSSGSFWCKGSIKWQTEQSCSNRESCRVGVGDLILHTPYIMGLK